MTVARSTAEPGVPRTKARPSSISTSAGRGLEQRGGGAGELLAHLTGGVHDRAARGHGAAAGVGAGAEGDGRRVAADHGHPLEGHAEGVGGDLGEARLVALARVDGAGGHDDAAAGVELHGGALVGADGGPLDVAGEADAAVDAALPQRRLLPPERGVAAGGERRLPAPGRSRRCRRRAGCRRGTACRGRTASRRRGDSCAAASRPDPSRAGGPDSPPRGPWRRPSPGAPPPGRARSASCWSGRP